MELIIEDHARIKMPDAAEEAQELYIALLCLIDDVYLVNGFLVSKETVVLRRWERSKQKFWFYQTS